MPKVALVCPAATVTLAGTVTGSLADSATTAPPLGAAAERATVPVAVLPPTTLVGLTVTSETVSRATVTVGDWLLPPFNVAVTVAVPAPTAVIVNAAVEAPADTVTGDWTVTTAGLLLINATLALADEADDNVTVPCPVLPSASAAPLRVTDATVGPVGVGADGVLDPPHRAARIAAATVNERVRI